MKNTVVDQNRDRMSYLFKGVGVEVGVADGDYAQYILSHNRNVTKLYGVDLYLPHKGYSDYTKGTTFNNMKKHAEEKLASYSYPLSEKHEFIFHYSMDAVKLFEDNYLDFVYIDADHSYKTCLEDITEWAKKVKSGGFVAGDDYEERRASDIRYGVIHAVDDYVKANNIPELFIYKGGISPDNWLFYKP
jgi:hypothetical protein